MVKGLTGGAEIGSCFKRGFDVYKKNFVPICVGMFLAGLIGTLSCGICTGALFCGLIAMILKAMRADNAELKIGDVFQGFSKYFLPALAGLIVLGLINQIAITVLTCIPVIGWLALIPASAALGAAMVWSLFLVTDQGATAGEAITVPLKLLGDKRFWSVVLVSFLASLAGCLGLIACGIGVLVTMPFAYCVIAAAFEEAYAGGAPAANEPPVEIPAS